MTDGPFGGLDFVVEIRVPGRDEPLCDAAFAECDGLELRLDVVRVREGGDPRRVRLVAGGCSSGEVTLRRGMTRSLDLWEWMAAVVDDPSQRADVTVAMLAPDGSRRATFRLTGCLPTRLRAPRLHATDAIVAVEELQLAAETLELVRSGRRPKRPAIARAVLSAGGRARLRLPVNPTSTRRVRDADGDRLELTVHLDATDGVDVGGVIGVLDELLVAPTVTVRWGAFSYAGRLVGVTEVVERFAPDGRPTSATVTLQLAGSTDAPPAGGRRRGQPA